MQHESSWCSLPNLALQVREALFLPQTRLSSQSPSLRQTPSPTLQRLSRLQQELPSPTKSSPGRHLGSASNAKIILFSKMKVRFPTFQTLNCFASAFRPLKDLLQSDGGVDFPASLHLCWHLYPEAPRTVHGQLEAGAGRWVVRFDRIKLLAVVYNF